MVEAPNLLGLHPKSMSYVYKVFYHLDMPWMGIWVYPYTVKPVELLVHAFGMDRISAAIIIIITGNRYSMLVDYIGTDSNLPYRTRGSCWAGRLGILLDQC